MCPCVGGACGCGCACGRENPPLGALARCRCCPARPLTISRMVLVPLAVPRCLCPCSVHARGVGVSVGKIKARCSLSVMPGARVRVAVGTPEVQHDLGENDLNYTMVNF